LCGIGFHPRFLEKNACTSIGSCIRRNIGHINETRTFFPKLTPLILFRSRKKTRAAEIISTIAEEAADLDKENSNP
jgi:hypothetical protein